MSTTTEEQANRRRRYLELPATKKDLVPIISAIRDIQQQLNITPLLRFRVAQGPDQGDDDFDH